MKQSLMIDALGRVMGERRDDSPIPMNTFGAEKVTRFSEVLFDEAAQMWYVEFRDGAPEKYRGQELTGDLVHRFFGHIDEDACGRVHFPEYASAVQVERAVLAGMMKAGEFNGPC